MLNTPSSKNICVYIVKCLQVLCAYLWGWYCDLEDYRNLIFLLYLSVYFNLFKNKNSFILELGLLIKPEKGGKEASLGPYTVDLKLQDWNEPWVGFANLIPMWEVCVCMCARLRTHAQSRRTLCNSMDCSPQAPLSMGLSQKYPSP